MARSRPQAFAQERERQSLEAIERLHVKIDALHDMFTGDPQRLDAAKLRVATQRLRASANKLQAAIDGSKA